MTQPLTAEDAARIALRLQPSLGLAAANVLSAQGKKEVVRAGLLPTGTLDTGYEHLSAVSGPSGGSGFLVQPSGYTSSIAISQVIFDFNHTLNTVRQADALERASRHALSVAQSDLVLTVKTDYYTYVQNVQLVHVQEANLASDQASLALASAQEVAGIGEPATVVTAQTNVAAAALSLAQARATALNSRVTLCVQMGIDARTPITLAPSEEVAPAGDDVNGFVDTALKNRPEIREYRETLRAAGYEVSSARTTDAPSISFAVGADGRGNNPIGSPDVTATLGVTWIFLDLGRQQGLVHQAQADVLTAKANLAIYSQSIVQDVTQAYVNLRSAEQQVQIAQSAVANGQESVRLAEGRFRAGVGLYVDIEVAQATLVTAQTQLVNAQTSVQQSRAALRHALGLA